MRRKRAGPVPDPAQGGKVQACGASGEAAWGSARQPSPAATMQDWPSGEEMMMVQVLPSPVDSTSTRPPLLVTPIATGASWYF